MSPLRPFPIDPTSRPRVLGVFAHPDDEVFCMGGTMAWLASHGATGHIISLTRGEAGQIRQAATATRSTLGAVRADELAQSAAALGATSQCFDFGDGTLADQPIEPLIDVVCESVKDFEPDVVISFGADGAYGHPDHIRSADVAQQALVVGGSSAQLLQAAFPQTEDLLLRQIVDWLAGLDDRFRGTADFAHAMMLFADGSSMLGAAADRLEVEFFPAGTYVIEQGESATKLYLILSGEVRVLQEGDDGSLDDRGLRGPGCFIGEAGLATGLPRNAHVVADTSVTCFVLSPEQPNLAAGRGAGNDAAVAAGDPTLQGRRGSLELVEPDVVVDVRDFCGQKIRALEAHRSQYALGPQVMPPAIAAAMLGTEYFRSASKG